MPAIAKRMHMASAGQQDRTLSSRELSAAVCTVHIGELR